ncbi:MAG: poly-gamma-glutamate biosynthesis protein [Leptolyngbya sp.]|nr:MAG: poly-gamma-glutamate biosynthesis protein [Leptolyngbya sp.]
MIWRSKAQDGFLSVTDTDLIQQLSWSQAQAGDASASAPEGRSLMTIAHRLATTLDDPQIKVEVSRRDRTLYVFLTAPEVLAQRHVPTICAAITALGLADITHLKVLDGTEKRLVNRWQHDFSLEPAAVPPQPDLAASSQPPEAAQGGAQRPAEAATPRLGQALGGDRAPAPGRRWRWGGLTAAAALGFGLTAAVTQWRYSQPPAPPLSEALSEAPTAPLTDSAPPGVSPIEPLVATGAVAQALSPPDLAVPVALTLKAVGDIIPGTDYRGYRLPSDWQYLFRGVQYHLGEADIVFGNFESTLTEVPHSAKDTSRGNTFAFRTPPWYASVLKEAGFDVLSVANNHSFDFFEQGFNDTIAHIEAAGMQAVGRKDEILYVEAQGLTVAFIGFSTYSYHNRVQDLEGAIALVQTAKAQADIVVVSFHAGKEGTDATVTRDQTEYFFSENRGNVVQFSRTVIDHGADLVLGHGPHVPRALELYNGKLIAYSLGNFVGYRSLSTVGPLGTSLILQLDLDAQGNFVGGQIIPVALDRNGVPYLDDHFGGVTLVRQFTQRDFPNTPLEIDDLGYIWPR